MNLIPLPAFDDHCFWLSHEDEHTIVIALPKTEVAKAAFQRLKLKLGAILVTQPHPGHTA